jgi:hypothetical protein
MDSAITANQAFVDLNKVFFWQVDPRSPRLPLWGSNSGIGKRWMPVLRTAKKRKTDYEPKPLGPSTLAFRPRLHSRRGILCVREVHVRAGQQRGRAQRAGPSQAPCAASDQFGSLAEGMRAATLTARSQMALLFPVLTAPSGRDVGARWR